jgi:anti-sigma B factor antagonist
MRSRLFAPPEEDIPMSNATESQRPGLQIEARRDGDVFVIALTGELDLTSRPDFDQALAEAERSDADRILIDLDQLQFIDSTGLQAILAAKRRSTMRPDRLRVTRGTGFVADMFRLTALDKTLPFA